MTNDENLLDWEEIPIKVEVALRVMEASEVPGQVKSLACDVIVDFLSKKEEK